MDRAADNIRILAASMVEKAKSGHPGGAMGGADFVNVLYSKFLHFDPDDMTWANRDRFFLDPGHMSPMLYAVLSLVGTYSMEDLQQFRQWGSVTPGHPEEEVSGRTTSLVSTLNVGAEYTFWENRFGIGLLSSTQFVSPKSYSELTVSANFRPGNAFGATLSYSFLRGKTIGLGIKLGNFFIGTDYMMTKSFDDAQRLNAYLGMTLGFGKKHNK